MVRAAVTLTLAFDIKDMHFFDIQIGRAIRGPSGTYPARGQSGHLHPSGDSPRDHQVERQHSPAGCIHALRTGDRVRGRIYAALARDIEIGRRAVHKAAGTFSARKNSPEPSAGCTAIESADFTICQHS